MTMSKVPVSSGVQGASGGATGMPLVLGRRGNLWVSAGVVAHTLWTSAAPAMAYRLYAEEWHLSHTVTTGIFAIYPIVVVAVLFGFGDISDHVGRRATMLTGLGASLAGTVLFAAAPDVVWLFAGRVLMGVGVGLTAGPSAAAVVAFGSCGSPKRAAMITTVGQSGGFAAALLLGGALTEYAPWPTRLSFWVLAALLGVLLTATWFMPRGRGIGAMFSVTRQSHRLAARWPGPLRTCPTTTASDNGIGQVPGPCFNGQLYRRADAVIADAGLRQDTGAGWRPRIPSVPLAVRKPFVIASIAMMTAYAHGVLVLSLGGQVAHDLVGSANAFVNGTVLSLFPVVAGVVGLLGKRLPVQVSMRLGAVASATGMGLLSVAVTRHGLPVFLLATAVAGAGYSLLFVSALEVIDEAAPADRRGGVLSGLFMLAYFSMGVVGLVLGGVATVWGLGVAVDLGAGLIGLLSVATFAFAVLMPLRTGLES